MSVDSTFGRFLIEAEDVPEWSGLVEVIGDGVGLMRVSNSDPRQHHAPQGWEITGHTTFSDGSFETYTLHRIGVA